VLNSSTTTRVVIKKGDWCLTLMVMAKNTEYISSKLTMY